VNDLYDDPVAKISLAVAVAKQAKSYLVTEFGVGEEIAPNMFGWREDELVCLAQLDLAWPDELLDRSERIIRNAALLRQGWGCTALTFFAEAYVSTDPSFSQGKNLQDLFATDKTGTINESFSFFHVESGSNNVEVCVMPYTIQVGKQIKWGNLMRSTKPSMLRESDMVSAVHRVMSLDIPVEGVNRDEMFYAAMAMGCHDRTGFFVQYDLS
jgi:hypothetical protein